jgi:hypothetical protein
MPSGRTSDLYLHLTNQEPSLDPITIHNTKLSHVLIVLGATLNVMSLHSN